MTLSTHVYVTAPGVDAEELFAWCNTNLIKPDREPAVSRYNVGETPYSWSNTPVLDAHVGNVIGQGFDSMLLIDHRNGELIDPLADLLSGYDSEEEVDEYDRKHYAKVPKHYIDINFDTAYGASTSQHGLMGCTELHALYIVKLAEHLGAENIVWTNEYEGTYHSGADKAALENFLGGGLEARSWFHNMVVPAIASQFDNVGETR